MNDNDKRFYVDTEDDDPDTYYVFDSACEPHKAVNSWSDKRSAEKSCDEKNAQ